MGQWMATAEVSGLVRIGRETAIGPHFVFVERTNSRRILRIRISAEPLARGSVRHRKPRARDQPGVKRLTDDPPAE